MSSAIMNPKMSAMDSSVIAVNRSKLMKLAEGIKTKKKPNHKKSTLNFKKDPGYTNIEHLVFGSYRPRNSPSSLSSPPPTDCAPATNGPAPSHLDALKQSPDESLPKDDEPPTPAHCQNGSKSPNWSPAFPPPARSPSLSPCRSPPAVEQIEQNVSGRPQPSRLGMEGSPPDLIDLDGTPPDDRPPSPRQWHCGLPADSDPSAALPYQDLDGSYVVPEFQPLPESQGGASTHGTPRPPEGSVHSPPVHVLARGKYLTHEFSADFSSPETAASLDAGASNSASATKQGNRRSSIYQTNCCLSSDSVNEVPARRAVPKSPKPSPVTARASMRIPPHKDTSLKDKIPVTNWSFRASAKGKGNAARPGLPRSVSSCAAAAETTVVATHQLPTTSCPVDATRSPSCPAPKKVSGKGTSEIPIAAARVHPPLAARMVPPRGAQRNPSSFRERAAACGTGRPQPKKGTGDETAALPLATSVQTMRKVSVSAANPARPTLSTKVKITVTANGEVNNNQRPPTTKSDLNCRTRCDSRPASRASFAETKSRSSSRGSLTGVRIPAAGNPGRTVRARTASAPAVVTATENLTARGRSSSASSLALGSASSLGGSQSSLYGFQARRTPTPGRVTPDPSTRHSFHAGGKSAAAVKASKYSSARASSIPSACNASRQSLRLPPAAASSVAGKPPVCPLKNTQSPRATPAPKDRTPTPAARTFLKSGSRGAGPKTCASATAKDGAPPDCVPKRDRISPTGDEHPTSEMAQGDPLTASAALVPTAAGPACDEDRTFPKAPQFGIEPATTVIETGQKCIAAAIDELQSLKAALNGPDEGFVHVNPQESARETGDAAPASLSCIAAAIDELRSLKAALNEPKEAADSEKRARDVANVTGPLGEGLVLRHVIRRTISLPKASLLPQWDDVAPSGHRRSLPARSPSHVSSLETPKDPGPAPSVHFKEISLSCSSKDGPGPTSTDILPEPLCDEIDRASVFGEPVAVEKVSLSVVDFEEGLDARHVDCGGGDELSVKPLTTNVGGVDAVLACGDGRGPEIKVTTAHEPIKSNCERSVPKCVRRIKAASSPVFVESRVESWMSEGDLHRPWSQICSDRDVERLVQAKSCGLGSGGSMAAGIETIVRMHPSAVASELPPPVPSPSPTSSQGNLLSRFSSMRTPGARPTGSPVEGVLQKFRKSFSARFYKKVKGESPPSPVQSGSASKMSARHASFSSYLDDGDPAPNGSVATSSVSDVSADGSEGETIFRLGPIVWRSSKEKKENGKKARKDGRGNESPSACGPDALEPCANGDANPEAAGTPEAGGRFAAPLTAAAAHAQPGAYRNCVAPSPHLLRHRSQSTTLHPERLKRPLSDQSGTALHGSIILPDSLQIASTPNGVRHPRPVRNGSLGPFLRSSSTETSPFPSVPVVRRDKRTPGLRWSRGRSNLRRSVSQPLEMEKMDGQARMSHSPGGHDDLGHDLSAASSDEELNGDMENGADNGNFVQQGSRHHLEYIEPVLYAEALWDHVTMDPEELAFKVGELVEVLDVADDEWWWGVIGNLGGWFPASFVRPRVNQENTVEDCVTKMNDGTLRLPNSRTMSVSLLSNDQVRTNVIKEIVSTERDFVRHLKDVCEGYLKQMRKRLDMFPEERINTIFGNIELLYAFQSGFVSELERCINWEHHHLSQIGSCFTEHREGFEMYSEYCNNHPQAVSELQQLYAVPKYAHFFEACRLLQDMIDISLDGFLLTPVQKICKYPLQLAELLKYTRPNHPDYEHVAQALDTMRSVAHYINERKRRMECLEKLAAWQMTVETWEGPDLLDDSSELIHSGDVSKVTASWSRDFTLFLFDHQLVMCKKDLLKRNSYSYKGRVNMDSCELKDIPDGKDTHFGLTLKNSWKLFCPERGKWIVFAARTPEEKQRWMKAFEDERWRVDEDRRQGFVVSDKAKKTAVMVVVQSRKKPKRPKDKENKGVNRRLTRPDVYIVSTKSGSLPSNVVLSSNKKKTASGWFHFGSNKKTKR